MIARAVSWSARRSGLVLTVAALLVLACALAHRALARDAIPDLSDPRIALVFDWMGHPATEVAQTITTQVTSALEGIPGATAIRGSSMSGMAYIEVVFASSAARSAGRSEIARRVRAMRSQLPAEVRPAVGPEASSTGWVLQYAIALPAVRDSMHVAGDLVSPASLFGLRRFQDEVLAPALHAVDGVAEIAAVGGEVEQLVVEARPERLRETGLAFSDLVAQVRAVLATDRDAGTERIESALDGLAHARRATEMSAGFLDVDGFIPAVGGIVIARADADPMAVAARVKQVLERESSRLPEGATLTVAYDRSDLVRRIEKTATRALAEEVAAVVIVVLLFLLHGRSALVPLLTLPFVVALTFGAMWLAGVPITAMSLSGIGIALGMAVDADVVALEACHRHLEDTAPKDEPSNVRRAGVAAAAWSYTPAIVTSLVIAALTFLPVLAFTGETGRLLRPLALTKTFVIAAAALVAVTLAPALRDRLLGGRSRIVAEFDNPLTRGLVRFYRPFVRFALDRPAFTLLTAGLLVTSCVPLVTHLGAEFLPRLDEGDLLFMPTTAAGVPPEQAEVRLGRLDHAIRAAREVRSAFGKVGRAETATDPAPFSMAEITVQLAPDAELPKVPRARWYSGFAPAILRRVLGLVWPEQSPPTTSEIVASLRRVTLAPGWTSAWTAPVRARMDMLSTGVRTPVGIRVVARDVARIESLAAEARAIVARLPGTRSAVQESMGEETRLAFDLDASALARHRVDPTLARSTADLLLTGGQVAEVVRGGRPVRVRVSPDAWARRPEDVRRPAELLGEATVRSADGGAPVPLALLGRARHVSERAMLRAERGELVDYVHVDLDDDVDLGAYVERARREVSRSLELRTGERIEWTGQYELWEAGQRRLLIIVPLVLLSMLALLVLQFENLVEALIVLSSLPFALVGSFWTIFLLGYRMSAPVWVGLLSVVGLAMQTGVVVVVYIDEAFHRRLREGRVTSRADIVAAHAEGTVRRLRPKIMTIGTMAMGLAPFLWAEGAGAEILKRVAAPMLGGLGTSAFLTLEVLPVLYTLWRQRQLRRAERTGKPLAEIVGPPPRWARA